MFLDDRLLTWKGQRKFSILKLITKTQIYSLSLVVQCDDNSQGTNEMLNIIVNIVHNSLSLYSYMFDFSAENQTTSPE